MKISFDPRSKPARTPTCGTSISYGLPYQLEAKGRCQNPCKRSQQANRMIARPTPYPSRRSAVRPEDKPHRLTVDSVRKSIVGYCDRISVRPGETIQFFAST